MTVKSGWEKEINEFLKNLTNKKNPAIIISSYKLTQEEVSEIKKSFPFLSDAKTVINEVDRQILGGLIIKYKNKIVDLSILGQLKKLKDQIAET